MALCLRYRSGAARLRSATLLLAALLILLPPLRFASAMERIKVSGTTLDGSTTLPTMSGSIVRSAVTATTTWFFYPGACADRANGTWAPRSSPQADSLNTYAPGSTGAYGVSDGTLGAILWHVSDNGACTPGTTCPPALSGSRMIWCGAFDANAVQKVGYPNFAYQILYIDTGSHAGNYNLTFDYQFSAELGYDAVYLIGGGGGSVDPIGNSRAAIDAIVAAGTELIQWTGSITPSAPGAGSGNTTSGAIAISENPGAPATVTGASFTIDASNRALYFVFESDCFNSNEDGLWPEGNGQMIDNLSTSDHGAIYTDQAAAGGVDAFSGNVLVGTPGAPVVSARVPPGVGTLWQLVAGSNLPTPDTCSPKNSASDLIFEGGNSSTFHTVPNQLNAIVSCTFPVPTGTGSILARWSQYEDMPLHQGYVQFAEYRYFKDSTWSRWRNTFLAGMRQGAALQFWFDVRAELAEATQADSVQIRYSVQCVQALAADHNNCGDVIYGVLYDNFRLEMVTGVPAPVFGILSPFTAQSTFVDGTMAGAGCNGASVAAGTCWPGVRGSDAEPGAVHDNFNSPLGDSIVVSIGTGLRRNGKGINWHRAFDRSVNDGLTIAHTNPNFVAAFDAPRVIYRLFNPATTTWSPFDSSELDANAFSADQGDTVLIDTRYRMNWPPRDKIGGSLPGGFSINGKTLYSQLAFLPRGTRLQYYFKGVDINGGTTYQFSSDSRAYEAEDLPALPGSAVVAPDILEFDVLPRVYSTAGTAGTLVAGKTNTPILNLDGAYTRWSYSIDPVSQALRALGVRADRYRPLQGEEEGNHVGGHELAGTRANRLASYLPNMEEYAIKDSLAVWYRIMIESSHSSTTPVDEEADARLLKQWWETSTGTDGGDRCIFASGDDYFNTLVAPGGVPIPNENALATSVFGVAAASTQWNGGGSVIFPTIKDLFADPAAGPALGSGSYTYQIDGGCPAPNRFDALTKVGSPEAQNAATYPTFAAVTNTAGVSYMTERDAPGDHDRNKALGYGFSIQFIRQGGENLLDHRAQVLYKFLTSCRGPRSTADTASCWPCPTDGNKYGNWAVLSGFQTSTYGPLYAIQNGNLAAAGVDVTLPPSFVDALLQNRPNPFNPQTVIPYSLSAQGRVAVRVYDVRGRLVRTLIDTVQPAGFHVARWNGSVDSGARSASGIYFYVITYPDGHTSSKKMAILR